MIFKPDFRISEILFCSDDGSITTTPWSIPDSFKFSDLSVEIIETIISLSCFTFDKFSDQLSSANSTTRIAAGLPFT